MLNNSKPKLLDMYCGAGGAAMGYYRAGFEIVGIDINPQPNYPFEFYQADALEFPLDGFDAYHASPPCQAYSWSTVRWRNTGKEYVDLIDRTRDRLPDDKPYIIENVIGAKLINPIMLCGEMFNLKVLRHRLFESNVLLLAPKHITHKLRVWDGTAQGVWNGGKPGCFGDEEKRKYFYTVAGHGGKSPSYRLNAWQKAMGIDWMDKYELTQAIPPAYTEYIGRLLIKYV